MEKGEGGGGERRRRRVGEGWRVIKGDDNKKLK